MKTIKCLPQVSMAALVFATWAGCAEEPTPRDLNNDLSAFTAAVEEEMAAAEASDSATADDAGRAGADQAGRAKGDWHRGSGERMARLKELCPALVAARDTIMETIGACRTAMHSACEARRAANKGQDEAGDESANDESADGGGGFRQVNAADSAGGFEQAKAVCQGARMKVMETLKPAVEACRAAIRAPHGSGGGEDDQEGVQPEQGQSDEGQPEQDGAPTT